MKKWKLLLVLGIAVAITVAIVALLSSHTAKETSDTIHNSGRILLNP